LGQQRKEREEETYDEDEVEVVDESPLDGVVVLEVDLG